MSGPDRRTLREWFAYLDSTERELTLSEFMAVMLFNSREYTRIMVEMVREVQNANEHGEAVLGSIDQLAKRIAEANGVPYPSSHADRAAMASEWRQARRDAPLAVGGESDAVGAERAALRRATEHGGAP